MTPLQSELFSITEREAYRPRKVDGFSPSRIVLAKGSDTTAARRRLAKRVCAAYPEAEVIEDFGTPHNRVHLGQPDPLALHEEGKRTLVLAEHKSAVRRSTERGNSCPNYWHFSPYGFCPYGCAYCYLAGAQGVRFSPTVKVFLNLPEILAEVDRVARRLGEPTACRLFVSVKRVIINVGPGSRRASSQRSVADERRSLDYLYDRHYGALHGQCPEGDQREPRYHGREAPKPAH